MTKMNKVRRSICLKTQFFLFPLKNRFVWKIRPEGLWRTNEVVKINSVYNWKAYFDFSFSFLKRILWFFFSFFFSFFWNVYFDFYFFFFFWNVYLLWFYGFIQPTPLFEDDRKKNKKCFFWDWANSIDVNNCRQHFYTTLY